MKLIFKFVLVVTFLFTILRFSVLDVVAGDTGLILWNKLGSTNEVENSELGSNGTYNAGQFIEGVFGDAVELNMQQQFGVTFPLNDLVTPIGCLEFWAKLSDLSESISLPWPSLIGWERLGVNNGYLFFFADNDSNANGGICARTSLGWIGTGECGSWTYSNAIGGGDVSEWHHYALSWNKGGITGLSDGTKTVAVYVDGILNTAHGSYNNSGYNLINGFEITKFGLLNHTGLVNGRVAYDNIKIWNYDKTDFSDRFVEDSGTPDPEPEPDLSEGLELYYDFSTDGGSVATDASGNGHDGAITGAIWQDGGPNGGYLSFDGSADYVNAGTAVNFPSWDQYTMSIWYLSDGGGDNTGYGQKIIDKSSIGHDTYLASVSDSNIPSGWLTYYLNEGGVIRGLNERTPFRGDKVWHHYVAVKDGAVGKGWLDGELVVSITNMIAVNSSSPLYIGYSASPDVYQRKAWSGFIDEVRIYSRPLSSNEVCMIYQAAVPEYAVEVNGALGEADPDNGEYVYNKGATVSLSVPEVVTEGTTRFVSAGATVEGNDFVMSGLTNVTLTITNDVSVTWNWQTQYLLEVTCNASMGETSVASEWYDAGYIVEVEAFPKDGYVFDRWLVDDTDASDLLSSGVKSVLNRIDITMDAAHEAEALFAVLTISDAVENKELEWSTGGDLPWIGQVTVSNDGDDAAASGRIGNSQTSWLETSVTTGGTLSFAWRVSAQEQIDSLRLYVDGQVWGMITGDSGWRQFSVDLSEGNHVFRWVYAKGKSGSAGLDRAFLDQVVWTPSAPFTLEVALDTSNLVWTTDGDVSWFPQRAFTLDGVDAAQSGATNDNQVSRLKTSVLDEGVLSFDWRVSCEEDFDWLVLIVDGEISRAITGDSGWQHVSINLGPGLHSLNWEYYKDESISEGEDCAWVDQVVWSGTVPAGFSLWLSERGIDGDPAKSLCQDCNGNGILNGFEYAFGSNLANVRSVLSVKRIDGRLVVEVPEQDPATVPYIDIHVKGCTNLAGPWLMNVVPSSDIVGKPAGCQWFEPYGEAPQKAFFKLEAELK